MSGGRLVPGAGKETMEAAYELTKLSRYLTLIHMMCYDYHGTWDGVVGANAPLDSADQNDVLTVEYTIKYMLAHGVSPYKLVLGLPMYGRNFILQDPETREVEFGRTAAKAQGFKGPFTKEAGFMGYNEICMELVNKSSNWTRHWHAPSQTPYLRDGDRVMSYDNSRSMAAKVKMAVDYGLGGLMVWSIDTDDFKGACGQEADAYVDFVARYHKMADDPVLYEALKTLQLPDATRLSKRTFYSQSNGKLHLRLPEPEFSNYNLMRTINDAAHLALEEKRITDEMENIVRTNEIDDKPPNGARGLVGSVVLLLCALVCLF
ncbi:hypothetical protein O0L34_g13210 [Tuta absoluta]|nr:hypothetical protein O0L34_g13210 [Tuta absoluta]